MSTLEKISFCVRATAPDLHLKVRFNGQEIFARELTTEIMEIQHEFDDADDIEHCLEIEMLGKIQDHTKIDQLGNIIEDRLIEISDVKFSDIELGYMVTKIAEYEHDTNGTTEKQQHKFFGVMGCNGVLRLKFTSPVYLWLLEHL